MKAAPLLLASCASLHALPKGQPCTEAGYAISARTFQCTGDGDLANRRFEAFQSGYDCIDLPDWHTVQATSGTHLEGDTGRLALNPPDAFHCAFEIRQLPCELVEQYGDDLDQWLASSDACGWVVEGAR